MNYPRIERPTEPGWYWYRSPGRDHWLMIEAFMRLGSLWLQPPAPMPISELSERHSGEWRGPIPEPIR